MNHRQFACAFALFSALGMGSAWAGPTWAFWDFNNTSGSTANDLTLTFTSNVTTNLNQVQNNPMTIATVNGKSVTFDAKDATQNVRSQGNCPKAFPACSQDFGLTLLDPGPTKLTAATWSLISGGNAAVVPLPNLFVIVGRKPNGNGVVSITNSDTQSVFFTGVDAATNITPSALSGVVCDTEVDCELDANPADNANAVAESNFSLAPGLTMTFPLGADALGDYTSVVFEDSFDSTFQTFSTVGFASDSIPEPPSWLMLVGGLASMGAVGFWRKNRVTARANCA